jgi:hypothetical protein
VVLSAAIVPSADAAAVPPAAPPAQFFGPPLWPGGFYSGPDLTSPYVGSPGYPYYRYGAGYASAFAPPYSTTRGYGAYYYDGPAVTAYPSYSSAGGVMFGDTWGSSYYPTVGRCLYGASAGYGGSWSDPSSYGYYAPYC